MYSLAFLILEGSLSRCAPRSWHGYCHRVSHQICSLALAQALSSRRFLFLQNDVILFNGSHTRCNSWPWQAFLVVGSLARCTPWYTGSQGGSLAWTGSRVDFFYLRALGVVCLADGCRHSAAAREGMPEWKKRRFWSSLFKVFSQIHNFPQLCCTCSCRGESPLSTGIGLHTAKCCQEKHCPFSLGNYLENFNRKFYEFLAKFWRILFYKMRKSVFFGPRNMLNMYKCTQKTLKIDRFCPFLEILFF